MAWPNASVLVADADKKFASILGKNLKKAGFQMHNASCGQEAMSAIDEQRPDLLVIDRGLSKISGIEICRKVRAGSVRNDMPILMLAENSDHIDLARALDIGADDFVHKPANSIEVVARSKALLRRSKPTAISASVEHKDIVLKKDTLQAYRAGSRLNIGPTEFKILLAFMEKPGRVWSREHILNAVWGPNTFVELRTIDVHVGRLRKALRNAGEGDPFRTVWGTGYALD